MSEISIVLPVYNSEKSIENTIKSVINQTYKDFELIIVDDGSNDGSSDICKSFLKDYKNIKYIKIKNSGVGQARNIGISKATGKYIMFLDSDDIYVENILESLIKEMKNENDLVVCGYKRIILENGRYRDTTVSKFRINNKQEIKLFIENLQKKCLFNQVWNKIYRRKIIIDNKIKFDTTTSTGEDYKFNLDYIKNINTATFLNEILYIYYSSREGLNLKYTSNKLEMNFLNLEVLQNLYEINNFNLEYVYRQYILTCLSRLSEISLLKKEVKNKEIDKFCNYKKMYEKLEGIKMNTRSLLNKIIIVMYLNKNKHIINLNSNILRILKKIYRRINIE